MINRYSLIAKTTLIAVVTSVTITFLIQKFFTDGISSTGFTIATIAPLLIAPPLSFIYVRLLEKVALLEQQQRYLASMDGLTQLSNRRNFDEFLAREWSAAVRCGTSLALFLLDVDFFKKYNDHYGHVKGDDCLKAIGRVLLQRVRSETDLAARYGGEEFVVVLPATSQEDALRLAEDIRQAVQNLGITHAESEVADCVTISGGLIWVQPTSADRCSDLTKRADLALYRSKESGRNRVTLWEG